MVHEKYYFRISLEQGMQSTIAASKFQEVLYLLSYLCNLLSIFKELRMNRSQKDPMLCRPVRPGEIICTHVTNVAKEIANNCDKKFCNLLFF